MQKNRAIAVTRSMITALLIAGCSHSSSSTNFLPAVASAGMSAAPAIGTMPQLGTNASAPAATGIDTGWTGTVGAPAPASFGVLQVPAQIATAGGPVFVGSGSYPSNISFPALSSSMQLTSNGLSAVATTEGASILSYQGGFQFSYRLVVPALNIDTPINRDMIDWYGVVQNYVYLDEWDNSPGTTPGVVYFAYGFETPQSAMPTSGSANFSGNAEGYIYSSAGGHILSGYVRGDAALSVDFNSGSITGALTKMNAALSHTGSPSPWNDVSVSAGIAAGTNRFSGTTAVTSAPQTPLTLSAGATGHVDGAFYGPAAQNIGAIWSLSDGTTSVLGGIAAAHP